MKHSEIQKRVAKEYTEEELDKINIKRKASWESHEEEVKKEYSERKKKEVSERWSKRTPEYREAIRQKIIATKKAKSEEQKRIDIEKQWLSFFNHTPEQLEERRKKKQQAFANMPETTKIKRSQKISKALKAKSAERSRFSKEMWAKRTPAERKEISEKISKTRRKNKKEIV